MTEAEVVQSRPQPWWRRTSLWLVTVVLAGVAGYAANAIATSLDVIAPPGELVEQALGGDAVAVLDLHHVIYDAGGAQQFVLPADTKVPSPTEVNMYTLSGAPASVEQWLAASGAVDIGVTKWEITLEGRRTSPVEIVDIAIVLAEPCGKPSPGGGFDVTQQGESEKIGLSFDAGVPRPRALDEEGTPYFDSRRIALAKGEKTVLVVTASAKGKHCRFRLRIDMIADGQRGSRTVSAPGDRPFEVTDKLPGNKHPWDFRGYAWVLGNPVICRGRTLTRLDADRWPDVVC